MLDVQVKVTGPVFDGRAEVAVDNFVDAAKDQVAEEGVNDVRSILAVSLRNPTGFYESQIQTDRAREDRAVTDSGVIYGPWLEGISQRNLTTRFKGYGAFRRATQRLQGKAGKVAEEALPPFLARMNN